MNMAVLGSVVSLPARFQMPCTQKMKKWAQGFLDSPREAVWHISFSLTQRALSAASVAPYIINSCGCITPCAVMLPSPYFLCLGSHNFGLLSVYAMPSCSYFCVLVGPAAGPHLQIPGRRQSSTQPSDFEIVFSIISFEN